MRLHMVDVTTTTQKCTIKTMQELLQQDTVLVMTWNTINEWHLQEYYRCTFTVGINYIGLCGY